MRPSAVVMNMFYTGLGVARSLGARGVPVIGLTAQRGVSGNFTRYARVERSPDSRTEPEALLEYLLRLGQRIGAPSVIFPTRDEDVVFLDRFRKELQPHFIPAVPESAALNACLNKWETYRWAQRAGVAAPKCWLVECERDLPRVLEEVTFPCVLKPLTAPQWRKPGKWELVGGRKAFSVSSREQLLAEYAAVARADAGVLVQEMIPGGDENLTVAACYFDRNSRWVAGFNVQKLLQSPASFGTGCIVQVVERPELFDPTLRLLAAMGFTGIAEVEYKRDSTSGEYKLIEINPRPWDQHPLGKLCGVDLIYLAYCEHAGLPIPPVKQRACRHKWIAEDAFVMAALRMLWKRDPALRSLLHLARGKRTYAIWSLRDPLPLFGYFATRFLPGLADAAASGIWAAVKRKLYRKRDPSGMSFVQGRIGE